MKRIAILLPEDQLRVIEEIRRKKRIPRSRVIQQAVALYLAEQDILAAVREYEEGYRRRPEGAEAISYATATAEALAAEEWD